MPVINNEFRKYDVSSQVFGMVSPPPVDRNPGTVNPVSTINPDISDESLLRPKNLGSTFLTPPIAGSTNPPPTIDAGNTTGVNGLSWATIANLANNLPEFKFAWRGTQIDPGGLPMDPAT